jgi:hypothetical protein
MKRLIALLLTLCTLLLAACTAAPITGGQAQRATPAPPAGALAYLISPPGEKAAATTLSLIDTSSWSLWRSVELPPAKVENIAHDPQGRLWVGLWRTGQELDNRVQIYSPEGELLRELRPCLSPSAGISFTARRAFIACAERGFGGSVAAIDLASLEPVGTLSLSRGNEMMLLMTSAATSDTLVVAAAVSSAGGGSRSVLSVIDARELRVRAEIDAGPNTDLVRALPYGSRVYLLNAASWRQPRKQANDLLVLDLTGEPSLRPLALAPSPTWAAITGDTLYAYHNPTWNQLNADPSRQISRLNLRTGAVETWPLPAGWHAGALTIAGGNLLLSHWDDQDLAADGLYRFDPNVGALTQVLQIASPTRMLVAPAGVDAAQGQGW